MKKLLSKQNNFLLFCSLIWISQNLSAQTIEKYYVNMPDGLNPTLSKQNRLELLEYHKAGQGDSITNRFGNKSFLLSMDTINQLVVVKSTASSTLEMKVLNLSDNTPSIGIIRTVCGPICQSMVEFYDTAWLAIPIQFNMPKATDWLDDTNSIPENVDRQWVLNILENSFISLSFQPASGMIIAKNNSLEFIGEVDRKLIEPLMKDKPLLFLLEGRKWVQLPQKKP